MNAAELLKVYLAACANHDMESAHYYYTRWLAEREITTHETVCLATTSVHAMGAVDGSAV